MQKTSLLMICLVFHPLNSSLAQTTGSKWGYWRLLYPRSNPGGPGRDSADSHGWNASIDYNLAKLGIHRAISRGNYCGDGKKENNVLFGRSCQVFRQHANFSSRNGGLEPGNAPPVNLDTGWGRGRRIRLTHSAPKKRWACAWLRLTPWEPHYVRKLRTSFVFRPASIRLWQTLMMRRFLSNISGPGRRRWWSVIGCRRAQW